jgi:membrane protein DedA with SNARE-associated domain
MKKKKYLTYTMLGSLWASLTFTIGILLLDRMNTPEFIFWIYALIIEGAFIAHSFKEFCYQDYRDHEKETTIRSGPN